MSILTKGQGQNGHYKIVLVFVTKEMKLNFLGKPWIMRLDSSVLLQYSSRASSLAACRTEAHKMHISPNRQIFFCTTLRWAAQSGAQIKDFWKSSLPRDSSDSAPPSMTQTHLCLYWTSPLTWPLSQIVSFVFEYYFIQPVAPLLSVDQGLFCKCRCAGSQCARSVQCCSMSSRTPYGHVVKGW